MVSAPEVSSLNRVAEFYMVLCYPSHDVDMSAWFGGIFFKVCELFLKIAVRLRNACSIVGV